MKRLLLIPILLATTLTFADDISPSSMMTKTWDGQTRAAALLGGPQALNTVVIGSTSNVPGTRPRDAQAQAAALLSRSR